MRLIETFMALGALESAVAHTVFTTLYVDGVSQGDGTCVRMNTTPDEATFPVEDLTSDDMACGIMGEIGVSRVCAANQSSTLTFQFLQYPDGSETSVIAASHLGPCAVYLKQVSSAIDNPGYGDGWFKIWESGYDEDTEEWCVTKLINAGGLLSVDLPSDIAGGSYLVRPELLALHNATAGDPQFFTGCAQVFLNSDATSIPTETVAIPGYVVKDDPSVSYDIYTMPLVLPYPIPGPEVYESSVASNIVGKRTPIEQTEGLRPEGCILEVANWFGMELDTYSTIDGCWNSSSACWTQDTACWADTDPTGGARLCPIWEDHCTSIESACNAGNTSGPPNAGTDLQPAPATIDLIMVVPSGARSIIASSATSAASSIVESTTNVATSVIASSTTSTAALVVDSTTAIATSVTSSSSTSVTSSVVESTTDIGAKVIDIEISSASPSVDLATYTTSTLSTISTVTVWLIKTKTADLFSMSSVASAVSVSTVESFVQSASQPIESDTVYSTVWLTATNHVAEGPGNTLVTSSADSTTKSVEKVQSAETTSTTSKTPQVAVQVAQTQVSLSHAAFTPIAEIVSAKSSSIMSSSLTTLIVIKSSSTESPSAEQTVTVTEFYCPGETGLNRKETRE